MSQSPCFEHGILDGKALSQSKSLALQLAVHAYCQKHQCRPPCLAVVQVGNDPASRIYVNNKRKLCTKTGIDTHNVDLDTSTTEKDLLAHIASLNQNTDIDGILVQLPLPHHIRDQVIIEAIDPSKDVDGFHPLTIGRLLQDCPTLHSCTPQGIMTLLDHANIQCQGIHAVIVGTSSIVGKPLALELLHRDATVTLCHKHTQNLAKHVASADLLVVAIGRRNVIQTAWLKPNCIVIDVGIHRLADGKIVGDVDFDSARKVAKWITPVPGGVGPMTVFTLIENTFHAYQQRMQRNTV